MKKALIIILAILVIGTIIYLIFFNKKTGKKGKSINQVITESEGNTAPQGGGAGAMNPVESRLANSGEKPLVNMDNRNTTVQPQRIIARPVPTTQKRNPVNTKGAPYALNTAAPGSPFAAPKSPPKGRVTKTFATV